MNRQTLPRVLVEDRQRPQLPTALGACFQKIIRPDLIGSAGTMKRARRVAKAPFHDLATRQLQAFLAPDAVDPLAIDAKTVVLQHRRDNPVAVHRLLVSVLADQRNGFCLIRTSMAPIACSRALNTHQLTSMTLRQPSFCH